MTFEELNLNKPLLNALGDLGFTRPTPIQQKVFSVVMSGRDVCGLAQTGTGKTFAYLLPCLRQYQFSKERAPQLLILVPTRELVVQVVESVQQLSTYLNLVVVGIYGGVNLKPQAAEVEKGVDVLVATPGRLVDFLARGTLKTKAIRRLVIDEVDEMLNLGFRAQLKTVLDVLPVRRQNLLFSATLTEEVEQLIADYFADPIRIEDVPTGTPLESIQQTAYRVPNFYTKVNLLEKLLKEDAAMSKVLVFTATKHLADLLAEQLEPAFPDQVGVIHSNKAQNKRFDAVNQFKSGELRILIATDILSRGLDVAEVSHVVNFDLPEEPESYIHRIGRTGRADQKGVAVAFVTEKDAELQAAIEKLMNYRIPLLALPDDLLLSEELLEEEKHKVAMKTIEFKTTNPQDGGGAFHEKAEKNKKVNVRRNYAEEKMKKYGKPIRKTRPNN